MSGGGGPTLGKPAGKTTSASDAADWWPKVLRYLGGGAVVLCSISCVQGRLIWPPWMLWLLLLLGGVLFTAGVLWPEPPPRRQLLGGGGGGGTGSAGSGGKGSEGSPVCAYRGCGHVNRAGAMFCARCGRPLG